MKVSILSMQRVQNFGSLLQSYSLKKIIEKQGHEVSFLDIENNNEDNNLLVGMVQDFSKEGEGNGLISKIKKIDKYLFNRIAIKKLMEQQNKLFNQFIKNQLSIPDKHENKACDVCVIGSDEVFNCLQPSPWGFTSQLFGNVKQAKKIITYAASCGSTTLNEVPLNVQNKIREAFYKLEAISVRDGNTAEFVSGLAGRSYEFNLDPVVVGNFDEEIANSKLPENLPEHYCIVYSYYNRINTEQEINEIKIFCRKYKMEIVSVGAPQMWIKKHIVCDPFQILKIFQNADFVITDTFHGTIFSAKYSNRFAILVRPSNSNKLLDLVERLSLQEHIVNDKNDIEKLSRIIHKKDIVKNVSNYEYNRTKAYLRKYID